jgi:hypothetical protein
VAVEVSGFPAPLKWPRTRAALFRKKGVDQLTGPQQTTVKEGVLS